MALHCWKGRKEDIEEAYEALHGEGSFFGTDEWAACYQDDWHDGTCMLEAGHDGAHDFTDDRDIGVRFVPASELPS